MEKELFNQVCSRFNQPIPDILIAIIEESCENVCKSAEQLSDDDKLNSAIICTGMTLQMLKATITASLPFADSINLNYRGCSFLIDKNHWVLSIDLPEIKPY